MPLFNLEMWGGVDITGNGSRAQILGLGLDGYSAPAAEPLVVTLPRAMLGD
jgi:hypothetical protein